MSSDKAEPPSAGNSDSARTSSPDPTPPEPVSPLPAEPTIPAGPEALTVSDAVPVPQTPQVSLCFLLVSGRRRPMSFEPETTVGRVKELVWNAWPAEWQDERPPAPSFLRILYLGKILQDEDTLKKLQFPIHTSSPSSSAQTQATNQMQHQPTIVHLSIRPYDVNSHGDDGVKKKRRRGNESSSGAAGGDSGEGSGCCCCVVC